MRSVIHRPASKCLKCQLALRWCLCFAFQPITSPLQISLLTHPREKDRPTSSGNLVNRLFTGSQQHVWSTSQVPDQASVCNPEREVWILHPNGSPVPDNADPASLQLLLLDGSWSETASMSRLVNGWGRHISLPMSGSSRFWLRAKQDGNRFSTAEALMFLLRKLQLPDAYHSLNAQFELHVYASLRARGKTQLAREYLQTSALETVMPEVLEQLHTKRSRDTELEQHGSNNSRI